MIGKLMAVSAAVGLLVQSTAALAAAEYKIVTASSRGTYIQIGRNLAEFIAPQADIALEALPSAGSAENVKRLRYEPGVKLALVQSDVYQAFLDQAQTGNKEARDMIRPLRVIMPLYNEEIYFIVREDSPLNYVHEIKDAKINAGELGSGTALTTTTLYRLMFNAPIPEANASFLSNEDALVKLTTDKSIDAVAVYGQPAKLLVDMKPEARKLIKLLKFDPSHPASQAALKTYVATTVRSSSYPEFVDGRCSRTGGEGVPRDLRFHATGDRNLSAPLRAIAVPEFFDAAGKRTPEMARSRDGAARSRARLALLSDRRQRVARLRRRQSQAHRSRRRAKPRARSRSKSLGLCKAT